MQWKKSLSALLAASVLFGAALPTGTAAAYAAKPSALSVQEIGESQVVIDTVTAKPGEAVDVAVRVSDDIINLNLYLGFGDLEYAGSDYIFSDDETTEEATETRAPVVILKGDVNGDGVVNKSDYTALALFLRAETSFDSIILENSDIDEDGCLDLSDLVRLQTYLTEDFGYSFEADGTRGDLDGDGYLNDQDLRLLRRYISGSTSLEDLDLDDETYLDINDDGVISEDDYYALRDFLDENGGEYQMGSDPIDLIETAEIVDLVTSAAATTTAKATTVTTVTTTTTETTTTTTEATTTTTVATTTTTETTTTTTVATTTTTEATTTTVEETTEAPTETTTAITESEAEQIASDEVLVQWAVNDYKSKYGIQAVAVISGKENGVLTVTLTDETGTLLDTYVIDTATGIGTNADDAEVNLPQTGNNSVKNWLAVLGALMLTGMGGCAVKASGIRRKED